jgi:hypothetical protein
MTVTAFEHPHVPADQVKAARRLWTLFEPIHAMTYFAAEALAAFTGAGLRGFWRGYFAGRAAPLGRVDAPPVTAVFFTFAAPMVSRALPAVWDLISPEDALAVRQAGAVAALRRAIGGDREAEVAGAAGLLATAIAGLDCSGRALASANAALDGPDEPFARLWHVATVLREHRGDGHFASLVAAGIDGCESNVLRAGIDLPRATIQPLRGWTDEEWDAAEARLAARGLIDTGGTATQRGKAAYRQVEHATDAAAARPWADLSLAGELGRALLPLARACARDIPFANPIGVPEPGAGR